MHMKISSLKWQTFCDGLNALSAFSRDILADKYRFYPWNDFIFHGVVLFNSNSLHRFAAVDAISWAMHNKCSSVIELLPRHKQHYTLPGQWLVASQPLRILQFWRNSLSLILHLWRNDVSLILSRRWFNTFARSTLICPTNSRRRTPRKTWIKMQNIWCQENTFEDTVCHALRWRHMNVMSSRITDHSTVCLTVYAHQRNINVRIIGHLIGEFTGDRWIPLTKGQ